MQEVMTKEEMMCELFKLCIAIDEQTEHCVGYSYKTFRFSIQVGFDEWNFQGDIITLTSGDGLREVIDIVGNHNVKVRFANGLITRFGSPVMLYRLATSEEEAEYYKEAYKKLQKVRANE